MHRPGERIVQGVRRPAAPRGSSATPGALTRHTCMDTVEARRPSVPIKAAAVLLAVNGALAVLYAGIAPLPFTGTVVPVVNVAFGVAWIVAAIGVWRLHPLGRALGVALCLYEITAAVVAWGAAFTASEPWSLWLPVLFSIFWVAPLLGLPLWFLLRRWPASR